MIHPDKLFGRLGNRMFQGAFMYAYAMENGCDYYFQSPEYFERYEEQIKALYSSDIVPINQISIHVRRGDYVNNHFYCDLTRTDYYERAIDMFPDDEFLVFSDDIEFCKRKFIGEKFSFCEEKDEVKALNLMAGCKHNIIANSSFSWWAGYLNPNPDKIVVAPYDWYSDGKERTVCPNEWKRI